MSQGFSKTKITLLVLALIGFLDSVYLLVLKLTSNPEMCIKGLGDCWSVNISPYSEIFSIPVSLLGIVAYLTLILLIWVENKSPFWQNNSILLQFGLTFTGVIYSAYLTYLEIAVIKAICPFCVLSAVIMLALFLITIARLVQPQTKNSL